MYKKFPINLLKRKKEGIYPFSQGISSSFSCREINFSGLLRHRGLLLAAVPGGIAQGVSGNDVQVPDHRLLGLCRISVLYGHVDLVVGLLGQLLVAGQIPKPHPHIGDEIIHQVNGGGQHGVVAGHGQGIVKLHIVHIVGGVLVQVADGLVQNGHVLLRGALAGQAHDAHLDDPAELVEGLRSGLRVDAVASMLYLDYGRTHWRRNKNGGRENLEAVAFLQLLNAAVHREKPGALMIAEESTAWPHVTGPEGLGFDLKWNMGWMNDLCHYLKMDPYFRQYHHKDVTFSLVYAFSERFVLPISHDEVVHMKGSLRGKMPGDEAMQLAGVKSFLAYMLAHPGCKLLFMGGELPQWKEWDFAGELDWSVLQDAAVSAAHGCIRALNRFYKNNPPLWENDTDWDGFSWLVPDDSSNNILVFLRRDRKGRELICAVNFSPVAREEYRFGVPKRAEYREVFNTDDVRWGGSGIVNEKPIPVEAAPSHGRETSIRVRIPPLGAVYLQGRGVFKQKKGADHP